MPPTKAVRAFGGAILTGSRRFVMILIGVPIAFAAGIVGWTMLLSAGLVDPVDGDRARRLRVRGVDVIEWGHGWLPMSVDVEWDD